MDRYIFIALTLQLFMVVSGNITVCMLLESQKNNAQEEYSLLVKIIKGELTALLESNTSMSYEHLDFDFHHPALSAKGELINVTVENINSFNLDFFKDVDIIKNEIEIFSLTFHNISTVGEYIMTGNIGELFDIWGTGHFWLNILNFTVSATTKLPIINSTDVCLFLDIKVKLQALEGWLYNLMDGDKELEEVINHSIEGIGPDAIEVIWAEIKDAVDGPLEEWINSVINKHSSGIIKQVLQKTQGTQR